MADITAVAAGSAASGAAALYIAQALGIEPAALFWAFAGAGMGLGVPRQSNRWRIIVAFPFAILGGAGLGAWGASIWFSSGLRAVAGLSFLAGFVMHPVGELVIRHLEPLFGLAINRFGVRK